MKTIITTIFILIGLLVYGQDFKDTRTKPAFADSIKTALSMWSTQDVIVDSTLVVGDSSLQRIFSGGEIWFDAPYFFGYDGSSRDTLNGTGSGGGADFDVDADYPTTGEWDFGADTVTIDNMLDNDQLTGTISTGTVKRDYKFNDGISTTHLLNTNYGEDIYVIYAAPYIYIRSSLSDSSDIAIRTSQRTTLNENFVFDNVYLLDPTDANTTSAYTSGTVIHGASDDISPISTGNVGFIGGNHGFNVPVSTTSALHGKDATDEGDIYTDGSRNYYLADVIDGTDIVWKPIEYYSGINWIWDISLSATMAFVSGDGDNQATIDVDSQAATQQTPAIKDYSISYLVNGVSEIATGEETSCRFLDVVESYTIPDPRTIPIAGTMDWTNGDDWMTFNITYRFQGYGACVVSHDLIVHDSVWITYMGFMQSAKLTIGAFDDVLVYSPKVDPIVVGASTWDLRNIDTLTTNPTSTLNITTTDVDRTTNPTDRMIEYLKYDGYDYPSVGFAYGYDLFYPNTDTTFRGNIADTYWNIATTGKSYPSAINENGADNTQSDTTFNIIAYRQYLDPERDFTDSATNVYYHKEGNYDVVYIDYHDVVISDVIDLPDYLDNKTIEVVENLGVTVSDFTVPSAGINVSCSTGYGYAVLRLSESYSATSGSYWEADGSDIINNSAGDVKILNNINLPASTSTKGMIKIDGVTVFHTFAGSASVFLGATAGNQTNTAHFNTGIGYNALNDLVAGPANTAFGYGAMEKNTSGGNNSAFGVSALSLNLTGGNNLAIGYQALRTKTSGHFNVCIGAESGENNLTGSGNVFIGRLSGQNETGSNKLYIENSNSATPLIHGDFSTDELTINGTLLNNDGTNTAIISIYHTRTFTILKPDEAQAETDDVILMNVHETAYPYGITIINIRISTSASCTDTHELEIWADRAGTSQSTIESITCSGQETDVDDGDIDTQGVDAGEYINVNLDNATDDISSLEITITFIIDES